MAKYKVGDWVEIELPPEIKKADKDARMDARILEVITQTCEAGVEQTSYLARIWTESKGGIVGCSKEMRIREMEIEGLNTGE